MRGVPISPETRAAIKAMWEGGAKYARIGRTLGCSPATVHSIINGHRSRQRPGGRPSAIAGTIPMRHDLGSRWCLKCGDLFRREYAGNFVCRSCRGSYAWQQSSPMEP